MGEEQTDEDTARLLVTWADRVVTGEQGWVRPAWLRQTFAALLVAQTRGGFDPIEHELVAALWLKRRAGEPAGDGGDRWREAAYVGAVNAVEAMRAEPPALTGQTYVAAVTDPPAPGRD